MSSPEAPQGRSTAHEETADLVARLADDAARVRSDAAAILGQGSPLAVPDDAIQALLVTAAKLYVAKRDAGAEFQPFDGSDLTATEVIATTTNMLKAANLEVFELTMWNGLGTM